MNKIVKGSIIFSFGAAVGSLATFFITRKILTDKYMEEIADLEEHYTKKNEEKEEEERPDPPVSSIINPEVPEEVREALLRDWNRPSLLTPNDPAESEYPKEDDDEEDEEEDDPEDEFEKENEELDEQAKKADEFYRKNRHKPPKIISEKDLGDVPEEFDSIQWDYFTEDDVMADEDLREILDYKRFIGDLLDKFDFRNNDEDMLYILSYEFACVYEITKQVRSYEELMRDKYHGEEET